METNGTAISDGLNGNGVNQNNNLLVIGSRDSQLAMKQTYIVRDMLQIAHPHLKFKIETMKTIGDQILDVALSKIGSKSLFTKELEMALADNQVDIVVHSLKDLPTLLPDGLVIGAICKREDPRDAVVMHPNNAALTLATLPEGSVVGTSSVRRGAQLRRKCPHLKFESVRGNLNTRFRKLDEGDMYAALILAVAGVERMGWKARITQYLDDDICMYAVGQGALAIECRHNDTATLSLLASLSHFESSVAAVAERALMRTLEGGCSAPVAVHSKVSKDMLTIKGGVWSLDGTQEIIHSTSVSLKLDNGKGNEGLKSQISTVFCGIVPLACSMTTMEAAHKLGVGVARTLLEKGALKILEAAKAENSVQAPNIPPKLISPPRLDLKLAHSVA